MIHTRMTCCRCNRVGLCKNCVCVKSSRVCDGCLPSMLGKCQNTSNNTHAPDTTPLPIAPTPMPTTENVATAPVAGSTDHASNYRLGLTADSVDNIPENILEADPELEPTPTLPEFTPMAVPTFNWGPLSAEVFTASLNSAYSEIVHWRPNLFTVPYGNIGKTFVLELSRLFNAFAAASALESVALKATMVMPNLLLQKPSRNSRAKDQINALKRRMELWSDGKLSDLINEGNTIQSRLGRNSPPVSEESLARSFAKLMSHGKTRAALRLLANKDTGTPLGVDEEVDIGLSHPKRVRDILADKHPLGMPVSLDSIMNNEPQSIHPVIFDSLDAHCIRLAALRTEGSAGPSGFDAMGWRRLCTSFKSASELCHSLAATAKRLCTCLVDPSSVSSLMACRFMALNKNPGVRPIGICETVRRIISKAILSVTKGDIQDAVGTTQLCAGQIAGIEAGIHSVRDLFNKKETEGVLLVDASNAFNSLNRRTALQNARRLCPSLATMLINTYREPTDLFVDGTCSLQKKERLRETPSQCLCMPSPQHLSSRNSMLM